MFWIVNVSVLPALGDAGVALAAPATSMPATKPTVTLTDALTLVYVLPLASVNDTVAVFVITVPSGVGDCRRQAGGAASVKNDAKPGGRMPLAAERKLVNIILSAPWFVRWVCYFVEERATATAGTCASYSARTCAPFGTLPLIVQRTCVYISAGAGCC